ncbi:hypothetical protein MMC14_000598 [Varicellaria rhodocarpa]|nr:hypothetical protein [Varicellaria rhodocarpa]
MRVCPSGPPFLRSWPFNLASLVDNWMRLGKTGGYQDRDYDNDQHILPLITRACSLSGRKPATLFVDGGRIPFQTFDKTSRLAHAKSMAQDMFNVYSSLQKLQLEFDVDDSDDDESDVELRNATRRFETGLSSYLAKCRNLKVLYLKFRDMWSSSELKPPPVSFDNVFRGLRYNWPGLLKIEISGMAATGEELVCFLAAFPRTYIYLGDIDLIAGGSWLTTFDALRAQVKPYKETYYVCLDLWEGGHDINWLENGERWSYRRFDGQHNPMDPRYKQACTCKICTLLQQDQQST